MLDTQTLPAGHVPMAPMVARWRFSRADGSLWLSGEALSWFGLLRLEGDRWKQDLLPRIALADRSRWVDALLAALEGKPVDCQIATVGGHEFRLLRLLADAPQRDGEQVGGLLLEISRDAREREALIELASLQRSVLDALPFACCAHDSHGDIILVNRDWRRRAENLLRLEGQSMPLQAFPAWLCAQPGAFIRRSMSHSPALHGQLIDENQHERRVRIRRSAMRQSGTPMNLLCLERLSN